MVVIKPVRTAAATERKHHPISNIYKARRKQPRNDTPAYQNKGGAARGYQNGGSQSGVNQNGGNQNGDNQNGGSQSGVNQNGGNQNGDNQNGGFPNGGYQNGDYQNGGYPNAAYQNGGYQNQNAAYQNRAYQNGGYQNGRGQYQQQPSENGWSNKASSKRHSTVQRSMWFVNVTILPYIDEDEDEEDESVCPMCVTQLVINYEKVEKDLNSRMTKLIQKYWPVYGGGFYVEPDSRRFERAVKKTKDWMKKCRTLSNPLHYSPPALPQVNVRLCEPLPYEGEEEEEEEGCEEDGQFYGSY